MSKTSQMAKFPKRLVWHRQTRNTLPRRMAARTRISSLSFFLIGTGGRPCRCDDDDGECHGAYDVCVCSVLQLAHCPMHLLMNVGKDIISVGHCCVFLSRWLLTSNFLLCSVFLFLVLFCVLCFVAYYGGGVQVLGNAKGKKFGPKEESLEHSRGRFLSTKEHRPPWQLSDAEQQEFDEKFSSFPFPDSFGSAPKKPFADASRLKGNDYCHILSDIGIYALKGALGDEQRRVLQQLCRILHGLTRTTLSMHHLYVLEQELLETLAGWELHFPYYCCTINFHLLLHLPQQIRRCGPVPFWWMYSLERECGRLVDSIHSLKCAEESMVRN